MPNKLGLLKLKMRECPESIVEQLLRKQYHIEKYQAKAHVAEAKGAAKANALTAKSIFKLPSILKLP